VTKNPKANLPYHLWGVLFYKSGRRTHLSPVGLLPP